MTEAKKRAASAELSGATGVPKRREEDAERLLGRIVARGLPAACLTTAVIVGFVASVPSALLVVASGALLGSIALLWASVRTLSGDAPLPVDLELLAAQSQDVDGLAEHKRRVLRALKDLESEHAIGKIDVADYEVMAARYRNDAKTVMREMDEQVAPALVEAERLASEYMAAHATVPQPVKQAAAEPARPGRVGCGSCGTSNEPDATFCKQCGAAMKRPEASDAKT
jgi:ribosomal protein L40E